MYAVKDKQTVNCDVRADQVAEWADLPRTATCLQVAAAYRRAAELQRADLMPLSLCRYIRVVEG